MFMQSDSITIKYTHTNEHLHVCLTAVMVIDQSHPLLHNFLKWHLPVRLASDANATTETMLWLFCSTISPAIVIHPPPSSRGRVSLLGRGRRVILKMCPHEMNSSPRAAGGPFGHGWNCITTNALTLTVHVSIYHWQIGFCTQHSALEIVDSEIVNTRPTCCN